MFNVIQYLPPGTKQNSAGWYTFNCPACVYMGENADKRKRGGLKPSGEDWGVHCFNCGFKAKFVHGTQLALPAKNFLKWIGVDEKTIFKINMDSLKNKVIYDTIKGREEVAKRNKIEFPVYDMPGNAIPITQEHDWALDYLKTERGLTPEQFDFKITPESYGRNRRRIIIPFYYKNTLVGGSSRFLDDIDPKYISDQPEGYVFGLDTQRKNWKFVLVVEGAFDAISIGGVAVLHNDLSEIQARLLRQQNKEIIIVPDQDLAGVKLAEKAIESGFGVSVPHWENKKIKDLNQAVREYGKIGTLVEIMKYKTTNKLKAKIMVASLKARLAAKGFDIGRI